MRRHGYLTAFIWIVAAIATIAVAVIALVLSGGLRGHVDPQQLAASAEGDDTAPEDVDRFSFDRWTTEMQVTATPGDDGDLVSARVAETVVPVFPEIDQNRGIVRTIPLEFAGTRLGIRDIEVTDADGAAVPFETDVDVDSATISVGDDTYLHGAHTFVLRYTLDHVIVDDLAADGVQELFANLLPIDRKQPIGEFRAELSLDPRLSAGLTGAASCYLGRVGATDPCSITRTDTSGGAVFTLGPLESVAPQVTASLSLGFLPGTVAVPSGPARWGGAAWTLMIGTAVIALVAVVVGVRRLRRGRPAPGGTVIPIYRPDPDLGPAQLATASGAPDPARIFTAEILQLAVAGSVQIRMPGGDGAGDQPTLVRAEPGEAAGPTAARMRDEVLLPDGDDQVVLHDNAGVVSRYTSFLSSIREETIEAGLVRRPPRGMLVLGILAGLWMIAAVILALYAASILRMVGPWPAVAGMGSVALAAVTLIVAWTTPELVRTAAGARVYDELLGLREYLQLAEADRLSMLQSPSGAERVRVADGEIVHVYERLLPAAVLLGLEREWLDVLQARYAQTSTMPVWFSGYPGGFSASALAFTRAATPAAVAPAPVAAGQSGMGATSGFSGGGFSGGGFGGGSVGGR